MHRLGAASLVVVAACGRLGFDPAGSAGDAAGPGSADATAMADAAPDAPPPTGPFGLAAPITELNSGDDDDPTLTADMLEIVFDSGRTGGGAKGGGDLWTATRASVADPWSAPICLVSLNTTGDDATPEISRDGLTLYWVANGAAGQKDIYMATRADRASAWSARVHVPELSTAADESGPTLTPDGLTMYLSNNASTDDDVLVSTRATASSPWSTLAPVSFNSPTANDAEPFVNGTNTLLVWSSARSGNGDLFTVRRAVPADPWGAPQPVAELNTTGGAEGDPWLSPDERVIVFSRDNALYMATR